MKIPGLKVFLIIALVTIPAVQSFALQTLQQGENVSTPISWGVRMLLGFAGGIIIGLAILAILPRRKKTRIEETKRRDRAA